MKNKNFIHILAAVILALYSSWANAAAYTYDSLNRLLSVDYGNGSVANYSYDAAGKLASMSISDVAPPAGSLTINNGAAATTSQNVTLSPSATDNSGVVAQIRFSNDNVTWTAWEPYATTKAWTLSGGYGAKTVYAQFSDSAANISTAATA